MGVSPIGRAEEGEGSDVREGGEGGEGEGMDMVWCGRMEGLGFRGLGEFLGGTSIGLVLRMMMVLMMMG